MNKYTKKWGAKVGETTVGGQEMQGTIQDRSSGRHQVLLKDGSLWGSFRSKDEAIKAYEAEFMPKGQKVHSIDITPAMKKSVLQEGQPIAPVEQPTSEYSLG